MKQTIITIILVLLCMPIGVEAKKKVKKEEVPQLINYPCADMNQLPLHGGEVEIKGRVIAQDPLSFNGQLSVIMRNYIANTEKNTLLDIKADGTFSLKLQVPYPMYVLVYPMVDVYACPGDTVDITIDTTKPTREEGISLDGTGLSGEVTRLTPKTRKAYLDFSSDDNHNENAERTEPTPDSVLMIRDKLVARLDDMVRKINAGLPELENCSPMASDIIRTYIVSQHMEKICSAFTVPKVEGLDKNAFWQEFFSFAAPRETYLLDNPILMISADWFFFNRLRFNLMYPTINMDKRAAMDELHDKLKLSPTDFSVQVCMLHNLVGYTFKFRNVFESQIKDKVKDYITDEVAKTMFVITNPEIMRQAVIAYNEHIKEYEMNVVEEKPMTRGDSIFQRIIEPYKGNVLYVDFWEMSCGPCRAGILHMRDEVEANKDKPVKYLYITDDTEEACRSFLEPNNVKGEHIHITRSEWGYLREKFQFSSIPYHFILDKDGKQRDNVTVEELLKDQRIK